MGDRPVPDTMPEYFSQLAELLLVRRRWLAPTATFAAAAAAAGLALAAGAAVSARDRSGLLVAVSVLGAVVFAGAAAALPLLVQRLEEAGRLRLEARLQRLSARFAVLITAGMQPLMEPLWTLASTDSAEVKAEQRRAAIDQVIATAVHIFGDSTTTRSVVYLLNDRNDRMDDEARTGRPTFEPPTPFVADDARGHAPFQMVRRGGPSHQYVEDCAESRPAGWDPVRSSYRTFISVPIKTRTTAYGILTVDRTEPRSLREEDVPVVQMLSDLVALALVLAG